VKLLLVGGGPQEPELRRLVDERGLQDRVVFAGRVPNAQVHRYYDLIDLLVYARHTMRLTELVTPLKPLEAMAQGRAFIASDVGGHRELIRHGETGFLFKAGSIPSLAAAVDNVISNRAAREEVLRSARRYVEHDRSWTNSVARYREMYERLAAERSSCAF
jgi:glycosyltransferase involved in cell wall biosynthesis